MSNSGGSLLILAHNTHLGPWLSTSLGWFWLKGKWFNTFVLSVPVLGLEHFPLRNDDWSKEKKNWSAYKFFSPDSAYATLVNISLVKSSHLAATRFGAKVWLEDSLSMGRGEDLVMFGMYHRSFPALRYYDWTNI